MSVVHLLIVSFTAEARNSIHPELVKRLRALTLKLLPYEVDEKSLSDPTGRIITPKVIAAYEAAAGDFSEAVSFHSDSRYARIQTLPICS